MSTGVYTKIKDLEIGDNEVFEFGNWLSNFNEDRKWVSAEDEYENSEGEELPTNRIGEVMEYPWEEFQYVIIPEGNDFNVEAEGIASELGSYKRFDIEDSDRVFFVIS